MTFEEWMEAVDDHLSRVFGITSDDLPDQTWRDWFDDGMTPIEAVREAIHREM